MASTRTFLVALAALAEDVWTHALETRSLREGLAEHGLHVVGRGLIHDLERLRDVVGPHYSKEVALVALS